MCNISHVNGIYLCTLGRSCAVCVHAWNSTPYKRLLLACMHACVHVCVCVCVCVCLCRDKWRGGRIWKHWWSFPSCFRRNLRISTLTVSMISISESVSFVVRTCTHTHTHTHTHTNAFFESCTSFAQVPNDKRGIGVEAWGQWEHCPHRFDTYQYRAVISKTILLRQLRA